MALATAISCEGQILSQSTPPSIDLNNRRSCPVVYITCESGWIDQENELRGPRSPWCCSSGVICFQVPAQSVDFQIPCADVPR